MSPLSRSTLLWTSIILFGCLSLGGYFYNEHSKKLRVEAAQVRWVAIQKKASAQGIYTDFDTFIEATAGEGPSLLSDFPELSSLFDPNDRTRPFSEDTLPGLKNIPSISAIMSRAERTKELRICLTTPLPATATEQEVYQAVLDAISPLNEKLDLWKAAVFASNNLGREFLKRHSPWSAPYLFNDYSNLLLLRYFCHAQQGLSDSSDIESVLKYSKLLQSYNPSLLSFLITLNIKTSVSEIILITLDTPGISITQNHRLASLMPTLDTTTSFTSALQGEYLMMLDWLTDSLEETEKPETRPIPLLAIELSHIKEEARADIAEFLFDAYFGPKSIVNKKSLSNSNLIFDAQIESSNFSEITQFLLSGITSMLGANSTLHNALKAQLTLESAKLSAYITLYQREHGHYPESLDSLVPEYLNKLPTIPYSALGYHYTKPTAEGEIPTVSAVIRIRQAEDITAQWPEAQNSP